MAARPPINEVVLSITLVRQSGLSGPLLPAVLGHWFTDQTRVEMAPPYEMPPEPASLAGAVQAPNVQLVIGTPSQTRYWLVSGDDNDSELVQVQPNYVALNWRRRSEDQDYPGYDRMRYRFQDLLQTLENGLAKHEGALKPTRVELTYINLILPGQLWNSLNDIHGLLNITIPSNIPYERLAFSYSQALHNQTGDFSGRLHVTLSPVVDWIKQEPRVILTLTVRSADLLPQNTSAVLLFMDTAHAAIEEAFLNLISEDAKSSWGLG